MYGNGTYFALNPTYSVNYARPDPRGHRRMYLAKVLVGEYAQGRQGLITPPPKPTGPSDQYDSVTDNVMKPSMFVIFSDFQAYPEFLITFT